MLNNKFKLILPSLLGLLFVAAMMFALTSQEGQVTPSALVGKPIPAFTASSLSINELVGNNELLGNSALLDNSIFQTDKNYTLLNVWASWCAVCQSEHGFLMKLAGKDGMRIVGLNYRDDRADANRVLSALGNPYVVTIFDPDGKIALDMGVVATPETYLLDNQGIVLFRYSGALDETVWQHYFKPFMQLLTDK
ncbi:MAG: DsbE family thiol:disulfide interchange protein [Moritella sp.]|uniref:DsbE family thiol:disulfide interchange protein n=1 Tax=Moritella sp. TaxID=78556 RepID=UPI0025FBDE59|nr:DsbE family thiol:disulfide interchange protein [Moritella sp.]NQZ91035.1 DsbE family thiol:disulfide interchange protein [Moritella sp.]